nr:uncharacterized protein LOC129165520 [Nothobranchius furzeri]
MHKLPECNAADSRPLFTTERVTTQTQTHSADLLTSQANTRSPPAIRHVTSQLSGQEGNSNIISVMIKQNKLTALLIQQQGLSALPKKEIPSFDGDPLQYQTFIRSFEHNIENRNKNPGDQLYYLEQHTSGQPRELVRSCLHMSPERGFERAKSLLQQHFGNKHKLATAYMNKALSWVSIEPEDTRALQAYTIFLRGCCNAMEDLNYIKELDMPANMLAIVKMLPYRLRDKWRTFVCDLYEKHNQQAKFKDMIDFLEKQVKIASDPVSDSRGHQRCAHNEQRHKETEVASLFKI